MKESIKECIKTTATCIDREGKDYRFLINECCLDEMEEDKEIIQAIIDAIEDYEGSVNSLKRIGSKISYATSLINHNNEEDLLKIFLIII